MKHESRRAFLKALLLRLSHAAFAGGSLEVVHLVPEGKVATGRLLVA